MGYLVIVGLIFIEALLFLYAPIVAWAVAIVGTVGFYKLIDDICRS